MQIIGSPSALKKQIDSNYKEKLTLFSESEQHKFADKKKELIEKHNQEIRKQKLALEKHFDHVYKAVLAEQQLIAKKEFETKREEIIEDVFKLASQEAEAVVRTEQYISMVRAYINNKSGAVVIGDAELKKHFDSYEIKEGVIGLVVREGEHITDFSYTAFMSLKKPEIRHKISTMLFRDGN